MPSTITLQSVIDTVSTSKGMKPLVGVGGIPNQPGLDICNDTLQQLLSAPYAWRFNKNAIPLFTTIAYQQDYIVSGCNAVATGKYAVALNSQGSATPGLTQAGTVVTATYSDFAPTGFPAGQTGPKAGDTITVAGAFDAKYNITATITGTPTSTSFTYTAASGAQSPDGGQGISNINWIEHVTMSDFQSSATVVPVHDAEVAASLPMESIIQPPGKWSWHKDNTFGSFIVPTFRSWPISSSQVWGIYLFYQARAPLLTDLTKTWTPWPDDLGYVLRAGVKAAALDWWEDPRSANSLIIFNQMLLKALGSKDQELRHESLFPDLPLMRGG